MSFKCEYCSNEFKRESTLARHSCKNKMRWLQKDEQHVRLGLKFFNDWYRIAMGSQTSKDYKQFMKSKYYSAFVRFGLYVLEARVIAPERYLDWLIRSQTRVDRWCKDSVYNAYLAEQSKKETAERALERFVIHAEAWSQRTGRHWSEYWNEVQPFALVNDIKMGKISPWVFLGHNQASKRLDDLLPELLNEIADTIDLAFWQRKLELNKPTVKWIDEILETSG
jgi:hypothetical protein